MSGGRRPGMGPALGPPYQPHPSYMPQHSGMAPMGMGQQGQQPPQRFMMGGPQMGGQMYGPGPTPQQQPGGPQMYSGGAPMAPGQPGPPGSQHPGAPVSPAARPPTPQHMQQQQYPNMQALMQNSPKRPSPAPSASSDHGSTHSNKAGDEGPEIKMEPGNPDDPGGDQSRGHPRAAPSPAGSTGSRSNTPASLPGSGPGGSPMPVRPGSGQLDGQNRMTQSPMATQGYSQQMMPPPNSMGYMPPSGKMGPGQPMPGHYPQYNSQYPQGNYGRQQPGMPGSMGGPPMSGPMQGYPSSQPGMYPGGPPPQMSSQMSGPMQGQMGGPPMYSGNMSRGNQGGYYNSQPGMMGGTGQYPPYSNAPHMGSSGGQMPPTMPHNMPPQQQGPPQMVPGQMSQSGAGPNSTSGPTSSSKAAQAAQAALMAAANTLGPRSMSSSHRTMSPSRGMFSQSPLAQMNNMSNSPNLGSPSLNSMSNAVEQLGRNMPSHSSSSPGPKSALSGNGTSSPNPSNITSDTHTSNHLPSPMSNSGSTTDFPDSSPRPSSTSQTPSGNIIGANGSQGGGPPDLPTNESTTGSDSSSGAPSDSTSIDSGFHSSDQSDSKTSDSASSGQPGFSPPPQSQQPNGEHNAHQNHYQQQQQHPHYPHYQQQQNQPPHHYNHMYPPRTSDNMMGGPQHPASQHYPHYPPPPTHMGGPGADPSKMPYNTASGVPLPPSTMSPIPPGSSTAVTTAMSGPMSTSVTQSIASPVTSVSTMSTPHPTHPQTQHMGGHNGSHGPPHPQMMSGHPGMVPPTPHHGGMMPNGMPPNSMMPPGHHMPPGSNMGGPPHGMAPPHSMNGPMMGPGNHMMGHNGPMMPPGGGNMPNMPQMGQMPPQQPPMSSTNTNAMSNSTPPEENHQPEVKKRRQKSKASDINKLFEMGTEPDRRPFLERVLSFLEETGQPVTTMPVISKTHIDLYKLYQCVREKGGFEEVTKNKKWRELCQFVNIGTSASAAFTLKKNYIRYLFNYECKYDRGGINPAPILAQMEAQLAHGRDRKTKRAPSPAGSSNSNDAFRPPSVSNSSDPGYPGGMPPPPYMQQGGPDGSNMPHNPHMGGGNMMMGPNNMMGAGPAGPHGPMSSMLGGPPGPNMMPGQTGMMGGPPPQMMGPGGPAGYNGGHMMPGSQQQQPPPPHGNMPNSVSVQDPFSDDSGYRPTPPGSSGHPTPPPPSHGTPSSSGPPPSSSHPNTPNTCASSYDHPPHSQQMGFQSNCGPTPISQPSAPGAQFPFGQKFERPDRFDQASPNLQGQPPRPSVTPDSTTQGSIYSSGAPRFSAPQYPVQGGPPYHQGTMPPSTQYSGYSQQGPPPHGGPYPGGPRPGAPMYGTPSKRFPEDHADRSQWSPMQRNRHSGSGQGYLPPLSPSTPPMGPYSRQSSSTNRERFGHHNKMPPSYGGQLGSNMGKKELCFPPDSVESAGITTIKRKRLTHKDLAPFEAWRLMLSLKSGQLAETSWALDTMNVLLYDDSTYGYFNLNTLPGLLEVLTEHLRHCLIAMFEGFDDLEVGQTSRRSSNRISRAGSIKEKDGGGEKIEKSPRPEDEESVQLLTGANYTMMSRRGLPVKLDYSPLDSSVTESKSWDVYCNFHTPSNHWSEGCGDITDHILTHFESSRTNSFMASKFKRKRDLADEEEKEPDAKVLLLYNLKTNQGEQLNNCTANEADTCDVADKTLDYTAGLKTEMNGCKEGGDNCLNSVSSEQSKIPTLSNCGVNKSKPPHVVMCNGDSDSKPTCESLIVQIKQEPVDIVEKEKTDLSKEPTIQLCNGEDIKMSQKAKKILSEGGNSEKPKENGVIEQPQLSPMMNHLDKNSNSPKIKLTKDIDDGTEQSPPVLKAEVCLDEEMEAEDGSSEPLNSTLKATSNGENMEANTSIVEKENEIKQEDIATQDLQDDGDKADGNEENSLLAKGDCSLNKSYGLEISETEEMSTSFVAEILREEDSLEEEAFQRDDPPLCVTPEDKDELGRRCVAISNIFRSLSCVPGNETVIGKHAGIMRILGKLLLLRHSHPVKPAPRRLPQEEDTEEKEEESPPRVYDDEHWWWDYLDQLRENTLVILANITSHLHLDNFSESVCFPLLDGLLHWLTCPASVARDPLPSLGMTSVLSPERLVLEALCKLCIHETNVDLLLATAHIKNLLGLYSTLVKLLSDRQQQIPREFSIVLLSFLVPADCTVARAVALQSPSVSLLVDFLETAEQAALTIATQQGIEALQANPESMGTSLDMLRRAAAILLSMSRVPDNRKMFLPQQSRLLNLVMSPILDQRVSNTLAEVLFECSQFS